MSLGFDEDEDQRYSFAAAAKSVIVWLEDQNALLDSVKAELPVMFRDLLKSDPTQLKALNLIPIDQSPPAFVPPGDPLYTDFANIKAGQVSGLGVTKAFPQLAALIENLKANPSGTSAPIKPQITSTTTGKGKGKKKRDDGGDNGNKPNKKGKPNADANNKTPKSPRLPLTPGLRKNLAKQLRRT